MSEFTSALGKSLGKWAVGVPVACFFWWLLGQPSLVDIIVGVTAGVSVAGHIISTGADAALQASP